MYPEVCPTIKIKKVPYNETDPVFTSWANSYSANLYGTYTTVYTYSSLWSSSLNNNVLSSLSSNWQSSYNTVLSNSANWQNTYNTVLSNSAEWNRKTVLFAEVSAVTGVNNTKHVYALSALSPSANIDISILTKGNGAFLLQVPDGTTSGGNKRGNNAVDFQKTRTTPTQVAAGENAAILNGHANTASFTYATVVNGTFNSAFNSCATVVNGNNNSAAAFFATIVNGNNNSATNQYSVIISGTSNSNAGLYSSILNGTSNSLSNPYNTIINGIGNSITGQHSTITGGLQNSINSDYSLIKNSNGAKATRFGQESKANAYFSQAGDAQKSEFLLYGISTDTNPVELTLDNNTNLFVLENNTVLFGLIEIIGIDEDAVFSQVMRKITVKNISNVYTLSHIESIGTDIIDAGNCAITVDNAKGIVITCSSGADKNTRWIASVYALELALPSPYTSSSILSINNGINNTETDINELFS